MIAPAEPAPETEAQGGRVRRLLGRPVQVLAAPLSPDVFLPRAVLAGRYGGALAVVVLAALLAALVIGTRLDTSGMVGGGPPPAAAAGPAGSSQAPPALSDREVNEQIAKMRTLLRVKLGLSAGLLLPLQLFALALALFLLAKYVGGKPTLRRTMALASHAALPSAVRSLVAAAVAWQRPSITPPEIGALVAPGPLAAHHPILGRLLAGVDPFTLWTIVLLCFGLGAAASISRRRAVVTMLVGTVLYLLLTNAVLGGPPPPPGGPR